MLGSGDRVIQNWAIFQWITKKRESGWSTFNPLKLGLKRMVESWSIELQTFALRMSLFWLFLNGFRGFWYTAYTYVHQSTTMHWDKCGTRKQLFWSSSFRLKNTSLPCLSAHSHTPPAPRLRLLLVVGVSFAFSFQFFTCLALEEATPSWNGPSSLYWKAGR